ncbi:uncharacterized protein [Miscanthus floridulus]|uniref:uncharacterized protein isoform X2 n=1 Tax=Miscanthus floridulus TaxID=154761 RepID=UPI003457ADBF
MLAAPSKCRPSAAALVVAPPAAARRRLRCRCCEDTLGVPRRRLQQQLPAVPGLHLNHAQQQQQAAAPAPHLAPVAAPPPPPRPRRIVLVQHGESEGNVDEAAYTRVPDPRIGLTAQGWSDADDCGRRLRDLFAQDGDDWKVYFYVSPYRRSLETLRGMGHAFEPHRIVGVREEPRLREQDFGPGADAVGEGDPPPLRPLLLPLPQRRVGGGRVRPHHRLPGDPARRHRHRPLPTPGHHHHRRHEHRPRLPRPHAPRLPHALVQVDRPPVRGPREPRQRRRARHADRRRRKVQPPRAPHRRRAQGVRPHRGDAAGPDVAEDGQARCRIWSIQRSNLLLASKF